MISAITRLLKTVEAVPFSGCWIWTGYLKANGYGEMWYLGRPQWVHRVAYQLWSGPIPNGLHVCHRCDVPCCVNPAHLFVGTCAENLADRHAKGRDAVGQRHGHAKLTDDAVREIRATERNTKALAEKYGVARTLIQKVRQGKIWTHVR